MSEALDGLYAAIQALPAPLRPVKIAVWRMMPPEHGFGVRDDEGEVQFISPAAWRRIVARVEMGLAPTTGVTAPNLLHAYPPSLMGIPVVDIDAGGPEADRLKALFFSKLAAAAAAELASADQHPHQSFTWPPR